MKNLLLGLIYFTCGCLAAQNSAQKTFFIQGQPLDKILDVVVNEYDSIVLVLGDSIFISNCKLHKNVILDQSISVINSVISQQGNYLYNSFFTRSVYRENRLFFYAQANPSYFVVTDRPDNSEIAFGVPDFPTTRMSASMFEVLFDGILFSGLRSNPSGTETINLDLLKLNFAGDILWKKAYSLPKSAVTKPFSLLKNNTGQSFLLGSFKSPNGVIFESFLIKFDENGTILNAKTLPFHSFENLVISDDAIFLLGKTKEQIPYPGNKDNAILAKLDHDLNPIWSKIYFGENFNYARSTLNISKDSSIILGYSTFGAFPVSLCKLDFEGNIIWQKGYPFYEPQIDVLTDGSILMATNYHFDSTGNIYLFPNIAKTDSQGNLNGCQIYPSCIESHETQITTEPLQLVEIPSEVSFYPITSTATPIPFQLYGFCDVPAPPSPVFSAPDTICFGKSLKPKNLKNHFAHGIEWRIEGPSGDTTIPKTPAPTFFFNKPGRHKIAQTVWFLGCDYRAEREIVVLEPLEITLAPRDTVCSEPPILLEIESNRPLKSFVWASGETGPSISVSSGGSFSVLADDGFCKTTDSTRLVFLSELTAGGLALEAGMDTTLCQKSLPFRLVPKSDFADLFIFKGSTAAADSSFLIEKAGVFTVSARLFGCEIADSLAVAVNFCEPKIYLPTVFSPNGDGQNDLFRPEGREFETVRLSIFDRWGGLFAQSSGPSAAWDGKGAMPGVFAFVLEFRDLFSGNFERIEGTVTVVK